MIDFICIVLVYVFELMVVCFQFVVGDVGVLYSYLYV